MQQKYDVVVIGSGIGGLGVAALLSHWGYRSLVVEKLGRVGGRCSTEEYEGFKLPTGAVGIYYKGIEVEEIFKEVGAQLHLVDVPRLFYRLGGKDYEMPAKGSIRVALDIINKLGEDRAKMQGGIANVVDGEKMMTAFRQGIKEPEGEAGLTFKDWLLQYTDNELLHSIFDTIANTTCGAHSYEISASAVFTFFVGMGAARNLGYAPKGNIVNVENLAKVVRANGDVWLNCPAKRILVRGKEAKGVLVLRNGNEVEIPCRVVISDVGLRATVELAGEENFDEEYLRTMRVRVRPHPITMSFVASDRPLWPESGEPAVLMLVGARRLTSVVPLSNISLELAPPGQHLMFAFGGPVSNEVHMNIELEQEQCLLDIKEQFPLFEKHGRILKMVSKDIDDEFPEARTRVGLGMPVETPVWNLYNVGDVTAAGGLTGVPSAAKSARQVAEIIRKNFKPGQA